MAAETRERIVEEARDLYLRGGLSAVSMRKVAERVGVSATALYRHFDDKESLLLAVVQTGFERFTSYLLSGLAGKSPLERLTLTGEGYLRFALDHPSYYRIMFMTSREDFGFDQLPAATRNTLGRSFQLLVDRVRECQGARRLRVGEPEELAVLIWSFVHGLVSLYLAGHMGPFAGKPTAFARFYTAAQVEFLAGLAP
ncbi:MAG TPA: TetR/AcrR family transcriptional regulator [Kofleriaceae bacterium]|nr:TetR/AcrR family transcriptional regulator [Kofleriaceae bacterium]